ncbi:hypothetical protein [Halobacterium sp. CBA1126]|uniref:hypothetical protein n=1 Tax=Halobacterium sp. CBA1126 TaxID=2668074 RepID=UPI0012F91A0D|nr:hypothetical protein [Halobacterium sp. CBA1126]MUV59957.1 hypothetical protein [Halobacterium sp. CBA1126]
MRRHFYLIVDSPNEDRVGGCDIRENRYPQSSKNEQTVQQKRNLESGETYEETIVSLGYEDYENEAEYEDSVVEDMNEKLAEIDDQHLRDAGVDPEEVGA